jgi:hypothetical protein
MLNTERPAAWPTVAAKMTDVAARRRDWAARSDWATGWIASISNTPLFHHDEQNRPEMPARRQGRTCRQAWRARHPGEKHWRLFDERIEGRRPRRMVEATAGTLRP